jgi:hypothetical protein
MMQIYRKDAKAQSSENTTAAFFNVARKTEIVSRTP